jgi:hypothetical protein
MSKRNSGLVCVIKTDKLNQQKLSHMARRYGVPPISVRELQLGYPEELPVSMVVDLERDGYVTRTKNKLRTMQEKVQTAAGVIITTADTDDLSDSTDTDVVTGDTTDEETV